MVRHHIKNGRIALWILRKLTYSNIPEGYTGDIEEEFEERVRSYGKANATSWIWFHALSAIPKSILSTFIWGRTMFNNSLKMALRHIKKYKGYTFINVLGLSLGIAVCLLIFLYVSDELSYDDFHRNKERIFRICGRYEKKSSVDVMAAVGPAVGPFLKRDFPQVEFAARVFPMTTPLVKTDDRAFHEERTFFIDQDLLHILTVDFIHGSPDEALTRPNTVVLSQQIAEKYFGHNIPIGKTIEIDEEVFEVTGVVENCPSNTHLKYDIFVTMESFEPVRRYFPNWGWTTFYTYMKLTEGTDPKLFEKSVQDLEMNYVSQEEQQRRGYTGKYFFQPIDEIHLHSHLMDELEAPGNPVYVSATIIIGLLVLIIACINFMNLSTARFASRAREVGLRKVVGAQRRQLIHQFLGESFLTAFIAFLFALSLTVFSLPFFNEISAKQFIIQDLLHVKMVIVSLALITVVGFASGSYPAYCLSSFRPGTILRSGRGSGTGNSALRKILVVGQFTISIALLVGTFVVYKQIGFMKHKDLGFSNEQKLYIPWSNNSHLTENYRSVKEEFSTIPEVQGVTASSAIPGYGIYGWQIRIVGEIDDRKQFFNVCLVDDDFIHEFDIPMVAGRAYKKGMGTDIDGPIIINETAATSLGWSSPEEAIGKRLVGGPADGEIIGVMKDFHFANVQQEIGPMVMVYSPRYFFGVTLTVPVIHPEKTIYQIQKKWEELNPDGLFTYRFVDSIFDSFYRANERTGKLFSLFTFLGIFISCLGLFGLVSYTAEKRTKEIGIRKTLGASVLGIVFRLSRDFMSWLLLAMLAATPLAYFAMNQWLKNFAYRINLSIGIFFLAASIVMVIAILSVSVHTLKAALSNPVDSLRYE